LEGVNATSGGKTQKTKPIEKTVMIYLTAIFVPPLYFIIKKKWLAFIVSSALFFLSLIFSMMVVLAPIALILWLLCSVCAVWDVRKALMLEHATIIADKMAEKMAAAHQKQPSAVTSNP
jgi:hypothetical protein